MGRRARVAAQDARTARREGSRSAGAGRPAVRSDAREDGTVARHGPRARRDPLGLRAVATATSCASCRSTSSRRTRTSRARRSTRRRSRRWPTRSPSAACCSPSSSARSPGGTLRARRRRAPLARGQARRPRRRSPRSCATRDDAQALEVALIENMAREDLNPVEEARACAALVEELGLTREEVGRRVGRSRVARLEPPAPARPARRGARADRGRRPHRGPRPRAPARRGPRRPPPPRPHRGRRGLVGPRRSRRRARDANADDARPDAPAAAPARRSIPTRRRRIAEIDRDPRRRLRHRRPRAPQGHPIQGRAGAGDHRGSGGASR